MLLSEVYGLASRGQGLPDKAVVLMFEPGYGHTYQVAAPILRWYKVPALWITNAAAVKRSNRRYVSNFRLWAMKRSGLWDVGFYDNPATLTLQSGGFTKLKFGSDRRPVWAAGPVTHALNTVKQMSLMNRLKVDPQWTDRELVARLMNEMPVRGTVQLSAQSAGGRYWGYFRPGIAFNGASFNLAAPIDKRAIGVAWTGTRGLTNFDVQLEASSVVGELWLLLRADPARRQAVRVGFLPGHVQAELEDGPQKTRLASADAATLEPGRPFSAAVSLHENVLRVTLNGNAVLEVRSIPSRGSEDAQIQLMAYNRIRGTAAAGGLRLILSPNLASNRP